MRNLFDRRTRPYALPLFFHLCLRTGTLPGMALRAQSDPADKKIVLRQGEPGSLYAVTIAVKDPAQLPAESAFQVSIADSQGSIAEKWLHAQDLDLYLTLRPRSRGAGDSYSARSHGPTRITQ